jgi:hypothetical protein
MKMFKTFALYLAGVATLVALESNTASAQKTTKDYNEEDIQKRGIAMHTRALQQT